MNLEEAVGWYKANKLSFYHFTDTRNLPLIRQHGLLSMRELQARSIEMAAGGNQWSFDQDTKTGMDAYVHLCFKPNHPMEFKARQDGRILNTRFIRISPEVLLLPGTLVCDKVSNKNGTVPGPPLEMLRQMDLEVLYLRTDWNDPEIKERLKVARCYEVIVPHSVPLSLLSNLQ